jgi:hypothetical protein
LIENPHEMQLGPFANDGMSFGQELSAFPFNILNHHDFLDLFPVLFLGEDSLEG